MSSSPSKSTVSLCDKLGIKPLTGRNILFYYLPVQGVFSYTALSVNVMNPSLVLRVFCKRDVTNILLGQTLLGSGLYLYNRPHLKALPTKEKVLYRSNIYPVSYGDDTNILIAENNSLDLKVTAGSFGAVTFSLGSVLVWAIFRSLVPQNVALGTVCGIGSGLAIIKIARSYVEHVDSLVVEKA